MLGHILSPCYYLMIYNGPSNKAQEDGSKLLCIIIEFTIFVFRNPVTNHRVQDKFITPTERLIISFCNFNRKKKSLVKCAFAKLFTTKPPPHRPLPTFLSPFIAQLHHHSPSLALPLFFLLLPLQESSTYINYSFVTVN